MVILAFNALVGGGLYLLMGFGAVSLTGGNVAITGSDVSLKSIDHIFRALSGAWCGLGLMLIYMVHSIGGKRSGFALSVRPCS